MSPDRSPLTDPEPLVGDPEAARAALEENPDRWYHVLELAPGVVTPGWIDLRAAAPKVLPADLGGKRALDVATFDGFWAFELERRGAEVVTIDLERLEDADFPPLSRPRLEAELGQDGVVLGQGFRLAANALGSEVERVVCNVYELEPERVGGSFDLAFVGALLTHLRDPIGALERVRSVLEPGGEVRLLEPISVALTLRAPRRPAADFRAKTSKFTWWLPNLATLRHWLLAAGFTSAERVVLHRPRTNFGDPAGWYAAYSARPR